MKYFFTREDKNKTTNVIEYFKTFACIKLSHSPVWRVVQKERTVGTGLNVFFSESRNEGHGFPSVAAHSEWLNIRKHTRHNQCTITNIQAQSHTDRLYILQV